jgi:tape measure domain-containing protein
MTEDLELHVSVGGEKAFAASIQQMNIAVQKLTSSVDKLDNESKGAGNNVQQLGGKVGGTASMFASMGAMLGGAAVVGGITALGKAAFQSASQYESLSISLGVLLGDASKVPSVLAEWKKFSDVTPFEPEQVNKAGKALLAFGFEAESLVPLMTKIGDVAAGTGKDFNELAVIYGKAKVAGRLMSEDINQLTEAGIPIMDELAAVLGTTADQVKEMASKGAITFPLFEQAFGRLVGSGGKFGGMMDKLSQSTDGILSTLKGEFDGLLREIGTAFLPVIKELALAAIPAIKNALVSLKPYLAELPAFFERAKATAMSIFEPLMRIYDALSRILAPIMEAGEGLGIFGNVMTAIMPRFDTIAWALDKLAVALEVVADAGAWVADTWNWAFGLAEDEVEGLSRNSKVYIKEMTSFAQKEFGASAQQVQAFAATLQASEFAGKSQAEALEYIKGRFAVFIQSCDESTTANDKLGKSMTDMKGKAIPAAGSIDYYTEALKKLKDQFNATGDASKRLFLADDIADAELRLEMMQAQGEAMEGLKTKTLNLGGAEKHISDNMQFMAGQALNSLATMDIGIDQTRSFFDKLGDAIGGDNGGIKARLEELKKGALEFGGQFAESIGYAIGSAGSLADAFKQAIAQMLVQLPKMAGMALLNAAAFPANAPIALPLAAAGLALLGLSGLIGGVQAKNAQEREDAMAGLPSGASDISPTAGGVGGFGGLTSQAGQTAPIVVNLSAEMDGVKVGGLFKRVTTDYEKSSIKQR